jgi:hypothetical protein
MNKEELMAEMRKQVAAVAREQGGAVVDLPQIESDVRVATMQLAIDNIWKNFAAVADAVDPIPAEYVELTERTLQALEQLMNENEEFMREVRGAK